MITIVIQIEVALYFLEKKVLDLLLGKNIFVVLLTVHISLHTFEIGEIRIFNSMYVFKFYIEDHDANKDQV